MIGLGLGYILEAVERRSPHTKVLAFEPLADTLVPMFKRRDWCEWISSGRLTLLYGPDFAGASDAWKLVDGRVPAPVIIVHPVLKREFSNETEAAHALARSAIRASMPWSREVTRGGGSSQTSARSIPQPPTPLWYLSRITRP